MSRAPGVLDVFARNPSNGSLQVSEWTASTGWSSWESLGGGLSAKTEIGVVSLDQNRMDVFIRGTDDALYTKTWTSGGGWGDWQWLGGILTGGPSATSMGPGDIEVFANGANGVGVVQKSWHASSGWNANWFGLGGGLAPDTGPSVTSRAPGYVDLAVTGTDNAMYTQRFRPGSGWSGWQRRPSGVKGSPSANVYHGSSPDPEGRVDFWVHGTDDRLYLASEANGAWYDWYSWDGILQGSTTPAGIWWRPSGGSSDTHLSVFVVAQDGNLAQRDWGPGGLGGWTAGPPPLSQVKPYFLMPGVQCKATDRWAAGSELGLSLGLDTQRVLSTQLKTFDSVIDCLNRVTSGRNKIGLRMQLRYDSGVPDGNNSPQVEAFRQLLARVPNAQPIVSVMSVDFTVCDGTAGNGPLPTQVGLVQAKQARCTYPTATAYLGYFNRLVDQVQRQLGRSDVLFTAWNEPEHPMFTLRYAGSKTRENAAAIAGSYWKQAVGKVGASRLLAGEFASDATGTLKSNFQTAAGQAPTNWAYHPYEDMTTPGSSPFSRTDSFQGYIGSSALWLTEIGVKASTNPSASDSFYRGNDLRVRLGDRATRAILYDLQASGSPVPHDSSLTDSLGRARPVICGLGWLAQGACTGNAANGG